MKLKYFFLGMLVLAYALFCIAWPPLLLGGWIFFCAYYL